MNSDKGFQDRLNVIFIATGDIGCDMSIPCETGYECYKGSCIEGKSLMKESTKVHFHMFIFPSNTVCDVDSNGWDAVSETKGYQYVTGSFTYTQARKECEDINGRLATFKNTEEFLWLKDNGETG